MSSAAALRRYLEQTCFHHIDASHRGLSVVNTDPFIFRIEDFVTAAECESLIALYDEAASSAGQSATAPAQAALRTSTSVFPHGDAIGWLRERIAKAANVGVAQLEPTKVTRYAAGEYFAKHSDASFLNEKLFAFSARLADVDEDGVQEPCEWPSRFCTCFLYLNDCCDGAGGRTRFRWLEDGADGAMLGGRIFSQVISASSAAHPAQGRAEERPRSSHAELSVTPRAGTAIFHLPTTTLAGGCVPDPRTLHESEAVVGEGAAKFIVQQFIWPVPIALEDESVGEAVRAEWAAICGFAAEQQQPPRERDEPLTRGHESAQRR